MPRKNRRAGFEFIELEKTILGDDYRYTRDPETAAARKQRRRERIDKMTARMAAEHREKWTTCVIPKCRYNVPRELEHTGVEFPMCSIHIAVIVRHVLRYPDRFPDVTEAEAALEARAVQIGEEYDAEQRDVEAAFKRDLKAGVVVGSIYYVRASGLIKVGYTLDMHDRLRAYGPGAELLVLYPGTRNDEKYLHRQLTPSRAKGREWYHEDAIVKRFISEALAEYGAPAFTRLDWTEPAQLTAAKSWRGRKAS